MHGPKKYIGISTGVLFILTLGAFWLVSQRSRAVDTSVSPEGTLPVVENEEEKPAEQPSGKIDEHLTIDNTLRDVNFCGQIYKVKQVLIDGVDVVQRVAELAKELSEESKDQQDLAGAICGSIDFSITYRSYTGSHLPPDELEIYGPRSLDDGSGALKYVVGVGNTHFVIAYPSLQINIAGAEEGGSTVIGTLK
jgi:hypothetical protein